MNGDKEIRFGFCVHIDPVFQTRITVSGPGHDDIEPLCLQRIAEFEGEGERDLFFPGAVRAGGAVVLAAVSGVDHDGADPPLRQCDVAHGRLNHIFEIQFRDERTSAEKRRGVEVSHGNAVEGAVPLVERHDDPGVAQSEGEAVVFAPRHGHSVKP